MRNKTKTARQLMLASITALVLASLQSANGRALPQDEVRDIGRSSWNKERAKTSVGTNDADKKNKPVRDKSGSAKDSTFKVTSKMPNGATLATPSEDSEIGLTFWRLRRARSDDAVEIRDLIQRTDGAAKEQWTPERVSSDTEFYEGQMVRLSIESLRSGFLYVINRAKYKDGTYGDANLIFPTQQINGGNNRVEAGRAVQIPGPDQEPFVLERGQAKTNEMQDSEELIILVTLQPFQSFPVAPPERQKLTQQSVENLIKKYSAPYEVSDQVGGAGRAISVAEKQAAKISDKRLGATDPYPQTIYRLGIKRGDPMLIKVELKVRSK